MARIVVIEDQDEIRSQLLETLVRAGHEVHGAPDGSEGLALVGRTHPDLVLCDVSMPVMDGHDVLRHLRADPATLDIPLVFLTARDGRSDVREGMNLGAEDYLTKPFRIREVLDTVDAQLARHRARRQVVEQRIHEAERHLRDHLYVDAATGLPNRFQLREAFEDLARRPGSGLLGLLVLGVERYWQLVEDLPAAVADGLARVFSERLVSLAGAGARVLRLAPDQFALVVPAATPDDVTRAAASVVTGMCTPLQHAGHSVELSCSAGVAFHPQHGTDPEALIRKATRALLRGVGRGGRTVEVAREVSGAFRSPFEMESRMRAALAGGRFELHYQPKVDLRSGHVRGGEALLRWRTEEGTFISPAEFIPAAEDSGFIIPLGEWVTQAAAERAGAWRTLGGEQPRIAFNVSAHQLTHPGFLDHLRRATVERGINPAALQVEVTESALMRDLDRGTSVLRAVRALGFEVAMDDFGTGYSSLSYLARLPFTCLKVDRSFVKVLGDSASSRAIVRAITQMAHQLGLRVVAEGVETEAQLRVLREEGCDEVQGFYYSPAVPAEAFERFLAGPPLPLPG